MVDIKLRISRAKEAKKKAKEKANSLYRCTITVEGADARISGTYPLDVVYDATSYVVPGHQYTMQFRNKVWDGRKKLFSRFRGTFPAGLTQDVYNALAEHDVSVMLDDQRMCPGTAPQE